MVKIIADSSADIKAVEGVCFQSVPMTIRAGGRDFVDNEQLDTAAMLDFLASHNGPSGTACPGPENWMSAFEGADEIFVVCITGSLSGTWSSAMAARELYLQAHPDVKIHVFDSLSTGPEMLLLIEKLASLICEGKSFDEICAAGGYTSKKEMGKVMKELGERTQGNFDKPSAAKILGGKLA